MTDENIKTLDTLEGIRQVVAHYPFVKEGTPEVYGFIYCLRCARVMKALVTPLLAPYLGQSLLKTRTLSTLAAQTAIAKAPIKKSGMATSVFRYTCVQCSTFFTALVY